MELLPGLQALGGNYSWLDVRGYYYKALTSAAVTEREANFADTFRGLGQLSNNGVNNGVRQTLLTKWRAWCNDDAWLGNQEFILQERFIMSCVGVIRGNRYLMMMKITIVM
jgi:hypothetical protein